MVGEAKMFTGTVNYRCLASQLRKDGFTTVPDDNTLFAVAKKTPMGSDLVRWMVNEMKSNAGNFHGLLAFHLGDVGDQ